MNNTKTKMKTLTVVKELFFEESNMELIKLLLSTHDNCQIKLLIGKLYVDANKKGILNYYNDLSRYQTFGFICISTQIGCPLKCEFCSNRDNTFKRNLTLQELNEQYEIAEYYSSEKLRNEKIIEIQFGGTGEPLFNLDTIYSFIKIVSNSKNYFLFPTTGFPLKNLTSLLSSTYVRSYPIIFQLSLHASTSEIRKSIIHISEIKEVIDSFSIFKDYLQLPLVINYMLIKNVNDEDASKLVSLLNSLKSSIVIKLSEPNFTGNAFSLKTNNDKTNNFRKILVDCGFDTVLFRSVGSNENAGCGQLVSKKEM